MQPENLSDPLHFQKMRTGDVPDKITSRREEYKTWDKFMTQIERWLAQVPSEIVERRRAERSIAAALNKPVPTSVIGQRKKKRGISSQLVTAVIEKQAATGRTAQDLLASSKDAWIHALGEEAGVDQPAKKSRTVKYKPTEERAKVVEQEGMSRLFGGAERFAIRT